MAWTFGDGFDLYAAQADAIAGYWDSGATAGFSLVAGRFAGSQGMQMISSFAGVLVKSSGANDAVHHFVCAFRQTAVLSGTSLGMYLQLSDGGTTQVCVVFRSDGAILLTSAAPTGTVLATYTGAVTAQNTWYAFEFEIVINNTTGSFTARKNGNTSNDFTLGSLNTRPGTNNYANKLSIGMNNAVNAQQFDDVLWRSDASAVAWVGDVRCYTRMPASSVSQQFAGAPNPTSVTPFTGSSTATKAANAALYIPFTATYSGTIASAVIPVNTAATGHVTAAIYDSNHINVLGTSSQITNPVIGNNTVTFASPPSVVKGTTYYFAIDQDVSVTYTAGNSNLTVLAGTTTYASFPATNPASLTGTNQPALVTINITTTVNAELVGETQQDGASSYVYDGTVNDADFYAIGALAGTPASTIAVTTRGFIQKSDAGTRGAAVQLKSGATTVQSTATLLGTTWGWLWRVDTTDPATGAAWTASAVNNATIGPVVTS